MQKKLLSATAGLLLSVAMAQADEALIIHFANGASQKNELATVRYINFVNNQMVVTPRNGTAFYFVLEELQKLTFGEVAPTNINAPTANNIDLSIHITSQGEVLISGETQVISLAVFDINGRRLLTSNTNQLNVSTLSAGVYLLNVETTQGFITKKFIRSTNF